MAINARTVRKLVKHRQLFIPAKPDIKQVVSKVQTFYEVYSGILDYRTGQFIRMDPVDKFTTLNSARDEKRFRILHPSDGQNAIYIVRRYHHGKIQQQNTD